MYEILLKFKYLDPLLVMLWTTAAAEAPMIAQMTLKGSNKIFTCNKRIFLHPCRCGTGARVWQMTGEDADILCGEWDSDGSNNYTSSGEQYNIALTIKEIVRHPGYVVNPGTEQSYLQNDVAVFKVDEGPLSQESDTKL